MNIGTLIKVIAAGAVVGGAIGLLVGAVSHSRRNDDLCKELARISEEIEAKQKLLEDQTLSPDQVSAITAELFNLHMRIANIVAKMR